MKKHFILITVLLLTSLHISSQTIYPENLTDTEELKERLSENAQEDTDISSLTEIYVFYLSCPLNLNTATEEQLSELQFLNDFQIASLIDYRRRTPVLSIYELLYIPGFREEEVRLLMPLVEFREPVERELRLKDIRRRIRQQILLRYQFVLEEQKGYQTLSDSILYANPEKSRYLGSPDKVYLRYKFDAAELIRAGILMEKDQGEEFFCGSNPKGFDFYSAYLSYISKRTFIRQLTLGDYHLRLGQGLLMWSSFAMGKSGIITGISRTALGVKGNHSVNESRYLRGASLTMGKGGFTFTSFISSKYFDASIEENTARDVKTFSTLSITGLHNTPSAIDKEKTVEEHLYGASLRYDRNRLHLGLNGVYQEYDSYCIEQDQLYEAFYFSGNTNYGLSVDYRYLAGKLQIFGESAWVNHAFAFLNGVLFYLHSGITISILHRHYQKSYSFFWSDAFREGSRVNNEEGFYLGMELQSGQSKFNFYADIYYFSWLRYRVNSPSQGYELMGAWERRLGILHFYFRYKREVKAISSIQGEAVSVQVQQLKQHFKTRLNCPLNEQFNLQGRMEISQNRIQDTPSVFGYFVCMDILYKSGDKRIALSGRIAWFRADEYETRLYVYERDILYSGGSQMHYGRGWRYAVVSKWKINQKLSFWCKLSQTYYPGEKEIGSGLNLIGTNHKTELKAQMLINF